jgi:xanthine dehydrogenase accessory factor
MERQVYEEILKCLESGDGAVLLTVTAASGGTPRKAGAKMLYLGNGKTVGTVGGGQVETLAIEAAREVLAGGEPRVLKYDLTRDGIGSLCGGAMEIFVEPVHKAPPIFIFGAGHVGRPLAEIAKIMGMRVNVVDDRPGFANQERFHMADKLWVGEWEEILPELPLDERSVVVIATYAHECDCEVLRFCIKKKLAYLGMIGSSKKVKAIFETMRKEGVSKEKISRVHAPVGLRIGAETPAEIAVSILSEIISVLRGVSPAG